MVKKEDIPEVAICHKCGEPMKVIDLTEQAKRLGVHVPQTSSYVIECCGFEQTIDDPEEAQQILDLLLAYHAETSAAATMDMTEEDGQLTVCAGFFAA